MRRRESEICTEILSATPLGAPLSEVRSLVVERYTASPLFAPDEYALTADAPSGPGDLGYPEARRVLRACVERDAESDPPTHVVIHWIFDEHDVLIGLASRRRPDSTHAV